MFPCSYVYENKEQLQNRVRSVQTALNLWVELICFDAIFGVLHFLNARRTPFCKKSSCFAKACCPPAKAGWNVPATHQRDPTTAPRGQFELLPEGPGPVPGSLSHLVATGFPAAPMRTQRLVRTPALHGLARPVDPAHQRSNTRALQ